MEDDLNHIMLYDKDNKPSLMVCLTDKGIAAKKEGLELTDENGEWNYEYVAGFIDYKVITDCFLGD